MPDIRPCFDIRYPGGYRRCFAGYPVSGWARYPAGYLTYLTPSMCSRSRQQSAQWIIVRVVANMNNIYCFTFVCPKKSLKSFAQNNPVFPIKPDIRPDIRYPAFRMAGYPAGRISGKFNIRHILNNIQIVTVTFFNIKLKKHNWVFKIISFPSIM